MYPELNANGVFGLGREPLSASCTSFIARARMNVDIGSYMYSYMSSTPIGTATLLLGGYDPTQYKYDLTWIDVPQDNRYWNSTV